MSGSPWTTVLGCIDTGLIYTYAQIRAHLYIFYGILLNPMYLTMPLQMKWQNFFSGLQYEHSCFILNLLASVKVISNLALRGSHFRIPCSAFSLEKKTLLINKHTKLCVKWAQNPKFCSFTTSFLQNQSKSILHPTQNRNTLGYHFVVNRQWESIWQAR